MLKKDSIYFKIYVYSLFNPKRVILYKVIGSVKKQTFRVLWMLEELVIPYEHQNVLPHSAKVLAYNFFGKASILLDSDVAIRDK